ncbi:hypothetical protein BLOT_000508 [Blomia tropicalis]|nr:hypothetical protein BLOT_000508 [Blomia tropicalis]
MDNYKNQRKMWPRFGGEIHNCPSSLKFIVQFYRCCGISFSGVLFGNSPKKVTDKNFNEKSQEFSFKSFMIICYDLFNIMLSIHSSTMVINANDFKMNNDYNNLSLSLQDQFSLGRQNYMEEFSDFKPILRFILNSIFYVMMIDGCLNHVCNLVGGGRLIRQIATIPASKSVDKKYGKKFISYQILIIIGMSFIGLLMFGFNLHTKMISKQFQLQVVVIFLSHIMFYIVSSNYTMLFLYSMKMYKRSIEQMVQTLQIGSKRLTFVELCAIKNQLTLLKKHFIATNRYFALPLTSVNMLNIYLIISGSCYLMTGFKFSKTNRTNTYSTFLFNFLQFGLIRLILCCWAGNFATNAYDDLIYVIYTKVPRWSLQSWICFGEIKQMRTNFKPFMLDTYTIRQSSIITMLGFALNYIVVLLQTENFS